MQKPSTPPFSLLRSVFLLGVVTLALAACSTTPRHRVIPVEDLDLAKIPDAVPKVEPHSANGNPDSYVEDGQRYWVIPNAKGYAERGLASWYGPNFHGNRTSSGEPYDMYKMTAAHKTLPLPTYLRVTNLENNRSIVVRVNDRGPFKKGRIIDLSYVAAAKLGIVGNGTATVEIHALDPTTGQDGNAVTKAEPTAVTTAAAPRATLQPEKLPAPVPAATTTSETPMDNAAAAASATAAATVPSAVSRSVRDRVQPPVATAVETPAITGEMTEPAATEGGTIIQVGAFSNLQNAERAKAKLLKVQTHPVTITPVKGRYQVLQRVQIGPFASEAEASKLKGLLIDLGFKGYRIINQ